MLKKLSFIAAGMALTIGAWATPLTPEQALSRLGTSGMNKVASKASGAKLVYTEATEAGAPAAYIFNNKDGYMVLSADDIAYPMLGYSDTGSIDSDNMSPEMKWWLGEYAKQIAAANAAGHVRKTLEASGTRADKKAIAPLVKTRWDQDAPYNLECPKSRMKNTYTGCVATAMAQVMNYWKYPEVGQGSITYKANTLGKNLTMDFSTQKFDWSNMIDNYSTTEYTTEQANAVAYLMKACGYSVKMDYGLDSSGAFSFNIAPALVKYFNYDGNAREVLRLYYGPSEWEDMIYEQLSTVGPVIYGGQSALDGGHSFVLDGYDGNGYFHFNWGWSGMSDGYFVLSALNPDALGTGGGSGGYNYDQHAMFGVQPPTGQPVEKRPVQITQYGSLTATATAGSIRFALQDYGILAWLNNTAEPVVVALGAIFEPIEGEEALAAGTIYRGSNSQAFDFPSGSGIYQYNPNTGTRFTPEVKLTGLKNGKYKVIFASQNQNNLSEGWLPVITPYGLSNYVILTKQGMTLSIENGPSAVVNLVDVSVDSPVYYNCNIKLTVTVKNDSKLELQKGFNPILYNGSSAWFIGESILLTVAPGETLVKTYSPSFYSLSGSGAITSDTKLYLTMSDAESNVVLDDIVWKEVTMMPNPGAPTLKQTEFSLKDAQKNIESILGQNMEVYTVMQKNAIGVNAMFEVEKGFYGYPMYALVMKDVEGRPGAIEEVARFSTGEILFLEQGQTGNFSTTIDFENGADELYYLRYYYLLGNYINAASGLLPFRIDTSGVAEIGEDATGIFITRIPGRKSFAVFAGAGIESIEVYDINGMRQKSSVVANGSDAEIEIDGTGVKVVVVTDINGNNRTFKVVL